MSDIELLFLVLAIIYAFECTCWIRRGSVGLRTWMWRRWTLAHPSSLLGNQRGGTVFAHPFPPLGNLLIASQSPVSLSPNAVLAFFASSVNPNGRGPQTGGFFELDQVRRVDVRGKRVLVNGEPLVKAPSTVFAQHLTQQLRHICELAADKREKAIRQMVKESFDTKAVEARWLDFQQRSRSLQVLTNVLFAYLFLAAPVVIWRWGFSDAWLWLVLGLLACTLPTAMLFQRAHRHFFPLEEDERFTGFLLVLLSPATAVRAHDLLSRQLLETFHPLAVVKVFCTQNLLAQFARTVLRELHYPALPLCPRSEPTAQRTEQFWRSLVRTEVESCLNRWHLKPAELLLPPLPTDSTCLSYCPRCQAQFTSASGECADCGGLPLLPFSSKSVATEALARPEKPESNCPRVSDAYE
jgi:hypothetical protein